ncbi:MAG TPA: hypothetical protein VF893_04665 [Candidatus Bathyarchaeia archaeon]
MSLFEMKALKVNKGIVTAFLLSFMLLVPIAASFRDVKAESDGPIVFSGGITIYSPVNTTYETNFLTLNMTCNCGAGVKIYFSYDIDGKYKGLITLTFNVTPGFHMFALGSALVQLPELLSGSHRLIVFEDACLNDYYGANPPGAPFKPTAPGSANYVASWVDTVYFTVDSNAGSSGSAPPEDSPPPAVTLLSIENKTYDTTEIPLNFTVSEESQVSYSLDGHDNVTITGNCTLTELPIGPHSLTLYARDFAGNDGASQTVDFTIVEETEPFPTLTVTAAAVIAVVVAGTGLPLYFKKRKRRV